MTIREEAEQAKIVSAQISKLVDRMSEEAYYGMNLKATLFEALQDRLISHADLSTLSHLLDKALVGRSEPR
jgi:hypothetical protein